MRLMVEIARLRDGNKPVKLSEITRLTGLSKKFMETLVVSLKSHTLLRGVCGRNGGYLLTRPPENITVGQVLTAVIGPINLAACVEDITACGSSESCESRLIWLLLKQQINDVLNEYTIADLTNQERLTAIRAEIRDFGATPPN